MNTDALNIILLNVGKAIRNADWVYTDVCSPFARIYYIVSGEASVEMLGQKYQLRPNYLYLIPPFVKHSTSCTGTFVHFYLHVYEDDIYGEGIMDEYDLPLELKAQDNDRMLFERLVEMNPTMKLPYLDPSDYENKQQYAEAIMRNKQRPDWVRLESRGIVFQIFSRFMKKAKAKAFVEDERIIKAIRYIHDHLNDPITIQQLADETGFCTGHFIRVFEQIIGMPPKVYVTTQRIKRAQHLLHATKLSIKEIATQLGYPDNSYFIRVFKRSLGMTPGEYREQLAQEHDYFAVTERE